MKVNKYYIIYTNDNLSKQYANDAAEQCKKLGLNYELYEGWKPQGGPGQMWRKFTAETGIPIKSFKRMMIGAHGCMASHLQLWQRIVQNKECAVILEHDGMMLHKVKLDIPDNKIVALGYKYREWENYDYKTAGQPERIKDVKFHPGSHAYAITHVTAQKMIDEVTKVGVTEAIDNRWFMSTRKNFTKIPMAICDPIAAIGWLRLSTIQQYSATHNNHTEMLESFKNNFKGQLKESIVIPKGSVNIINRNKIRE